MIAFLGLACGMSSVPEPSPPQGPTVTVQLPDVTFTIRLTRGMKAFNASNCDKSDADGIRWPCLLTDSEPPLVGALGMQTFTFGLSRYGPPLRIHARVGASNPDLTETRTLPNNHTFVYKVWFEGEPWDRKRFNARGQVLGPDQRPRFGVVCSDFPQCLSLVDTITVLPPR